MKKDVNIDVHHLTRVEGHGNIRIRIENGVLKEANWEVVETPRYFEVMLRDQRWDAAQMLTSRICGICSIGHSLASVRTTERAFGITVPTAAEKLRLLSKHGETLQSHYLHLFFLATPDFLGLPSVVPLIESHPELVGLAARCKQLANDLCDEVCGRTTHPVSIVVGGMARFPDKRRLMDIRTRLENSVPALRQVADLFHTFQLPEFERATEFVSLCGENEYPFIGGKLKSSDGIVMEEDEYRAMTNEYAVEHTTSKLCKLSRNSFAVGALARLNNNYPLLHKEARKIAKEFSLKPVNSNPFMNNVAQLVECVHCTYDSIRLIQEIFELSERTEIRVPVHPVAGIGVGAVEVPRGILYHEYEYNDAGRIVKANCIIPTTQNNANIQDDLVALVAEFSQRDITDKKLELLSSMLVRAYDPCISCSVH